MQFVDLLITRIDWLITVDAARRVIRDATIAIDQGKIVAIGKSPELLKQFAGRRMVDGRRTVATPGFIDCHLHSSFQLSRGLADEANAQSFLFERMYPYEAALDADSVRISAMLAAAELIRHGVTCFIDPGNYHPEAALEGIASTGIRAIVSRSSFDLTKSVLGILPDRMIETTQEALARAEAVLERSAKSGDPRLGASASFRGTRIMPRTSSSSDFTSWHANTARCCRRTPVSAIPRMTPAWRAPAWPRSIGSPPSTCSTSEC